MTLHWPVTFPGTLKRVFHLQLLYSLQTYNIPPNVALPMQRSHFLKNLGMQKFKSHFKEICR